MDYPQMQGNIPVPTPSVSQIVADEIARLNGVIQSQGEQLARAEKELDSIRSMILNPRTGVSAQINGSSGSTRSNY